VGSQLLVPRGDRFARRCQISIGALLHRRLLEHRVKATVHAMARYTRDCQHERAKWYVPHPADREISYDRSRLVSCGRLTWRCKIQRWCRGKAFSAISSARLRASLFRSNTIGLRAEARQVLAHEQITAAVQATTLLKMLDHGATQACVAWGCCRVDG
jgi:hypothetical protein